MSGFASGFGSALSRSGNLAMFAAWLRLVVDVAQCLPVVIPDDEAASVVLFDVPWWREAALLCRHVTPSSWSTIRSAVETSATSCWPSAARLSNPANCRQVNLERCSAGRCFSTSTRTSASVCNVSTFGDSERPRQGARPVGSGHDRISRNTEIPRADRHGRGESRLSLASTSGYTQMSHGGTTVSGLGLTFADPVGCWAVAKTERL